ncbi:hypothetical protein F4780DRAFT_696896 [Xylariomycetidae sp. FL0641]|nr:hypothetical protein F4780DRAFT_696896 [Xylariomycetidae sp. FL0641]
MCGNDINPRQSLGGALAVLTSLQDKSEIPVMFGRLEFHHQNDTTYATLTGDDGSIHPGVKPIPGYRIGIHETGDLTQPARLSPYLYEFDMKTGTQDPSYHTPLTRPMKIEVGGDGIIGRRVSLFRANLNAPVAEGIIGYN